MSDVQGEDEPPWGWIDETGEWRELPKVPMMMHLGPPPFDVTLPSGEVRHVIYKPE